MKSIIIFGSKYGTAEMCARKLKEKLGGEVDLVDINTNKDISLSDYDKVIIGGSIYMGMMNKEIKNFVQNNKEELIKKDFGLFMVCMSDNEKAKQQFKENFDEDILKNAKGKVNFGGAFLFSKMNFFERQIIKMISKSQKNDEKVDGKKDINRIDESSISDFVKIMN
ncbi:flavodoxin domain-containing protein [Clostridium sp. LP20]|uniref:flavodoxin domain-containing protein n=1 Tax=Clostridium sp. LP20 TaxID=3418665 RepID=UPI003EE4EDAC